MLLLTSAGISQFQVGDIVNWSKNATPRKSINVARMVTELLLVAICLLQNSQCALRWFSGEQYIRLSELTPMASFTLSPNTRITQWLNLAVPRRRLERRQEYSETLFETMSCRKDQKP